MGFSHSSIPLASRSLLFLYFIQICRLVSCGSPGRGEDHFRQTTPVARIHFARNLSAAQTVENLVLDLISESWISYLILREPGGRKIASTAERNIRHHFTDKDASSLLIVFCVVSADPQSMDQLAPCKAEPRKRSTAGHLKFSCAPGIVRQLA